MLNSWNQWWISFSFIVVSLDRIKINNMIFLWIQFSLRVSHIIQKNKKFVVTKIKIRIFNTLKSQFQLMHDQITAINKQKKIKKMFFINLRLSALTAKRQSTLIRNVKILQFLSKSNKRRSRKIKIKSTSFLLRITRTSLHLFH